MKLKNKKIIVFGGTSGIGLETIKLLLQNGASKVYAISRDPKKVKIRNPNASRPWQHVIEILNGYLKLAKKLSEDKKLNGQSFNFGPKNTEIVPVKNILEHIKNNEKLVKII